MPKLITETACMYGTKSNKSPDLEPRPQRFPTCMPCQVKRLQVPLYSRQRTASLPAAGSKAAAQQKSGTLVPCAGTSYLEDTQVRTAITSEQMPLNYLPKESTFLRDCPGMTAP